MTKKPKCNIKGCKKEILYVKHGLCPAHYMRLRRFGDVGSGKIRKYEKMEAYSPNK